MYYNRDVCKILGVNTCTSLSTVDGIHYTIHTYTWYVFYYDLIFNDIKDLPQIENHLAEIQKIAELPRLFSRELYF